jgi:hypothetical protein
MAFEAITIESQEQFDTLVKERLDRHEKEIRTKVGEEYADYENLKANTAKHEEEKTAWETAKAEYETKLTEQTTRIAGFEIDALKVKVVSDAEIPFELRDKAKALLTGSTKEELAASAKSIKELIGNPQFTPPVKDPELGGEKKNPLKDALKDFVDA